MQFIARPPVEAAAVDEVFNGLALDLFSRQFEHDAPFRNFCRQRGRTPRTVRSWHDIPAVPINGFKDLTLSSIPVEECERVFMTSGTTRAEVRGRHHHPDLQVYDLSMTCNFRQRFMSAFAAPRVAMGILFPDEGLMPNSSLAHYLALALHEFGDDSSRHYIDAKGLQTDELCAALDAAVASGRPYALLGASYSLVHFIDALQRRGRRYALPEGSRLFDTGGFKGQSREMAPTEFYRALHDTLGVRPEHCINMYGMTELSTQFYDQGNDVQPSVKSGPHWIRTRVLDPLSGQEVPPGERGILAHTDLANYNSVLTILTEDVGVQVDGGFLLLGRAQGTQAKGCSLAVDEFLRAATR